MISIFTIIIHISSMKVTGQSKLIVISGKIKSYLACCINQFLEIHAKYQNKQKTRNNPSNSMIYLHS